MDERWYAVYTKPRWEKKVADTLSKRGITNYCPLNRVTRQWSDRVKVVYQPLFISYVFVRATEKQINGLLQIDGIFSVVNWLGKPAVIRDTEIENIRNFLNDYSNVRIQKHTVNVNDKVKVTKGLLSEREGNVVAIKNNIVRVAVPSLGFVLFAELEISCVERSTNS